MIIYDTYELNLLYLFQMKHISEFSFSLYHNGQNNLDTQYVANPDPIKFWSLGSGCKNSKTSDEPVFPINNPDTKFNIRRDHISGIRLNMRFIPYKKQQRIKKVLKTILVPKQSKFFQKRLQLLSFYDIAVNK